MAVWGKIWFKTLQRNQARAHQSTEWQKTKQFPLNTSDYHVFVPYQEESSMHITGFLLCECPCRHWEYSQEISI